MHRRRGGGQDPPRDQQPSTPSPSFQRGGAAKMTSPASSSLAPPRSSKSEGPPERPGYGTLGDKVMVRVNHFLMEMADKDRHRYEVTITPTVTSEKVNRGVISELVRMYGMSDLGEKRPAYDGWKKLYTAGPLPFESKQFVVKLTEDSNNDGLTHPESSTSTRKEREFKVAIKYAARVDAHHLRQFPNTVFRMAASEKNVVVGGPSYDLGGDVECRTGYHQSLWPTQMGLSFNIDASATAFFEAISVNEFVAKYLNVRGLLGGLLDQDRAKVEMALKGVEVRTTHLQYPRTYKITGVSPEPVNQKMFTYDGKTLSVADYFFKRYEIKLQYPLLPALQAGNEARHTFLPMEVCTIVEGQRWSRKLNKEQVAEILIASCQQPSEREASIKKVVTEKSYNTTNVVKDFGISVEEQLALINARVLTPPLLKYDGESVVNNMSNKKMGQVYFWTLVNFSQSVTPDEEFYWQESLIEMCSRKGMFFVRNPIVSTRSAHPNQIEKTLVDVHKQAVAELANLKVNGNYLQLLIVILPDRDRSGSYGSYGKIKRICETELGIVTQCCRPLEVSRSTQRHLESLSLKINVKVGGINMELNGGIDLVSELPTIIFGADVTHPSPGDDFSPSIAAVVASMDWPQATKYRGIVSSQSPQEEIIQDLYKEEGLVAGGMIRELLLAFKEAVGYLPQRIIFYRDGVSQSQFSQVLRHEMSKIWKACGSLGKDYSPKVTFIVVQKRHHTRFFPADGSSSTKNGNILPGTVVDTEICHPRGHDFYLNSHAAIKGTSRPIHYHVLHDDNNFSADGLQGLTNNLCYTYAKCHHPVSIVPPVYYAHLAAFRARYYLGDNGRVRDGNTRNVKPLPTIKGNVKDVMFFC